MLTLTNLPPSPSRKYVADAHRAGAKVKLYYTVRSSTLPILSIPVVSIISETEVKLYYTVRRSTLPIISIPVVSIGRETKVKLYYTVRRSTHD